MTRPQPSTASSGPRSSTCGPTRPRKTTSRITFKVDFESGSINFRWRYWYRMLACRVFHFTIFLIFNSKQPIFHPGQVLPSNVMFPFDVSILSLTLLTSLPLPLILFSRFLLPFLFLFLSHLPFFGDCKPVAHLTKISEVLNIIWFKRKKWRQLRHRCWITASSFSSPGDSRWECQLWAQNCLSRWHLRNQHRVHKSEAVALDFIADADVHSYLIG